LKGRCSMFKNDLISYEEENSSNNSNDKIIVDKDKKNIVYQPKTPTIESLYLDYKNGDLILNPEFQRNFVWQKRRASDLIESIILNIPLPLIYLAEVGDKEEIIDGQQRLTSIFSFIDGFFPDKVKFKLSKNLKLLGDEIGGKTFQELDKKYQKQITKRALNIITISEESQEDVKFEMFERLNTKITSLKTQELRNCLYRGPYNDFIKRMANSPDFQYILDKPDFKKRMTDIEYALIFFAFFHTNYEHWNKNLTQMLNLEMRKRQNISSDTCIELEKQFKKSVYMVKHIWGKNAFNMFSLNVNNKRGTYSRQLNQGLYQIIMYWFTPYKENEIIPFSDLIREEMQNLQLYDHEFINCLTGSGTNSPRKIKIKFDIWGKAIKGILNYPVNNPRAFSYKLKEELFEKDKTCQLCGQRINSIDDAEVDHIHCYWEGGKTIPENARLTHRICNRKRGGNNDFNGVASFDNKITMKSSNVVEGLNDSGNLRRSRKKNRVIVKGNKFIHKGREIDYDMQSETWLLDEKKISSISHLCKALGYNKETHQIGFILEEHGYQFEEKFN
jgi:hypothetical protein